MFNNVYFYFAFEVQEAVDELQETAPDKLAGAIARFRTTRDVKAFAVEVLDSYRELEVEGSAGVLRLNNEQWLHHQFIGGVPRRVSQDTFDRVVGGSKEYKLTTNKKGEQCIEIDKPEAEDYRDRKVSRKRLAPTCTGQPPTIASTASSKRLRRSCAQFFGNEHVGAQEGKEASVDSWADQDGWGWDSCGWAWGQAGWDWDSCGDVWDQQLPKDRRTDPTAFGHSYIARPAVVAPACEAPTPTPSKRKDQVTDVVSEAGSASKRRRKGEVEELMSYDEAVELIKDSDDELKLVEHVFAVQQAVRAFVIHTVDDFKVCLFNVN